MNSKASRADAVLAWPSAEIAVMGRRSANIIFRKEIAAADDAVATREQKLPNTGVKFSNLI